MARDLFIDMTNRRLATGLSNMTPAIPPRFIFGDSSEINLYFLQATGDISAPFDIVDMTGSDVKFAVGKRSGTPSNGTFTLSFGGDTSGAIGYSATAGAISSALNSLSAITAIGGISVDGTIDSTFVISFNSAGTRSAITSDVSRLIPTTSANIDERIAGNSTTAEVQELQLRLSPATYQSTWTDLGTAMTVSVSTIITGSAIQNEIQKIDFSRVPYQGNFSVTVPAYSLSIVTNVINGIFETSGRHGLNLYQEIILTGFSAISGYTQGGVYFVSSIPFENKFLLADPPGGSITQGTATITAGSIATTVAKSTSGLSPDITALELQSALENLSSIKYQGIDSNTLGSNVNVSGSHLSAFQITFTGDKGFFNMPQLQVQGSLLAAPGKSASVDFNSFGMRDYLQNKTSLQSEVEIELTTGTDRDTIILQPCIISRDIIPQGGIS